LAVDFLVVVVLIVVAFVVFVVGVVIDFVVDVFLVVLMDEFELVGNTEDVNPLKLVVRLVVRLEAKVVEELVNDSEELDKDVES